MSAPIGLVKKKEAKGKKRKGYAVETDQDAGEKKTPKIQKADAFTEVDFKVALRNSSATFTGFEKFIEAAERWPGDAQYDIVEGFLRSSSECSEIFQILESGKRKVQELQLIFRCLEKILLRIAEDLEKYYTTGQHIVRKLLTTQLPAIYFTLNTKHKSSQIKSALKLLVAMVMLGPSVGKTVLNQIDLNHANIKPLFLRRDSKDEEDVRTCLLHFIVAFLLVGDNELIRRLADTKGFLANVFQGVVYDRVATIQLVLSTFLEKIIMNPVISKTSKVHIFTETSLKQLGQLYNWKGPGRWKDGAQKKSEGEIEEVEDILEAGDRHTVAQTVHTVLIELCSSYKYGINFMDKTYGTSGRNQNHMLTSFLSYLSSISHNALVQELIVAILEASPDQLKHFLPQMIHSLMPRATSKWVNAVRFLCRIYEAQPSEPHILKSKEHVSANKVVNILLVHTLPPPQVLNTVLAGVKNKSIPITHTSLGVVKVLGQKCVSILRCLSSPDCVLRQIYSAEELPDITTAFQETVMKSLPDSLEIFHCLDRLQSEGQSQANDLTELCQATTSDVMVKIEQVMCLYQDLHPTLLLDHPLGMVKLLEGVAMDTDSHLDSGAQIEAEDENEAVNENEAEKEVTEMRLLPQLYLLKLLSGTDARRLPWGKEGKSGQTLMYQLLSMVTQVKQNSRIREIALELICKLLASTGLFDTFSDELYIWMKHLQALASMGNNRADLLTFVSKVMMIYMNNPYPYMDRVTDLVSEVVAMTTGQTTAGSGKKELDRKIEEILSMDLSCLEDDEEDSGFTSELVARRHGFTSQLVAKRQPFCPVLLVAMDQVSVLEEKERADVKLYVSSVILDVFHSQTDPIALCLAMKTMPNSLVTDGLLDYLKTWLPPYKIKKPKSTLLSIADKVQGHLMQYLLGSQCGEVKVTGLGDIDLTLTLTQCLLYVRVLLDQHQTETARSKFTNILAFLTHLVSPETLKVDSYTDSCSNTTLPTEFSELEIKKSTGKEKLESIYRIILENPTIKSWFLDGIKDSTGKQRNTALTADVTNFVKTLLIFINDLDLGKSLEEELGFFIDKILECVTHQEDVMAGSNSVSVSLLTHVLNFLDTTKSISVLNSVLENNRGSLNNDGSLTDISKHIINSLCNQTRLSVKLSDSSVNNVVKLTCSSEDTVLLESVVHLFEKFPNLSVCCTEENLIELLQKYKKTVLLEIIISNNIKLRRYVEAWFTRKSRWVKENRKMILPLVERLLCFHTEQSEVVGYLETVYMPDILTLCHGETDIPEEEAEALVSVLQHFIRLGVIEKKTLRKLEKRLESVLASDTLLQLHHIRVIQMIHGCQATAAESHDMSHGQNGCRKVLRFCVQGLVKPVKDKDKRNQLVVKKILEVIKGYSETEIQELGSHWEWLVENWPHLLKGGLKYLYTEPGALQLLTDLLKSLYQTEQEVSSVSIETIVAMVTSHSSFLPVMFNEDSPETKEPLLDLLIQLITLRPESCQKEHVWVYLGSYGATLSVTDQKILKLMYLYERNGVELSDFKPYLWGEKAIEHHTLRKSMGDTLLKQPTMAQVLAILQSEKIAKTILNFPLRRKLQSLETKEAEEYKSLPDCYDPCFLLPLFSHLLAPAAIVDCRKFIESDCLGLVFTALSSHDLAMRRAACHVIERYRDHLEGARFMEMDQIKYILGLLRDSMSGLKVKLACIVTVFLARAVKVMLKPDDHMYGLINIFLLLKPSLDVGNIPEFYKLFNSSALEYKTERQWILSLLHDGLRETGDYRIFEKRYTFKLLQSFYDSDLSDTATQVKVLQILSSACRERSIALDLVRYHGFLTWLTGAVHKVNPEAVGLVSHLVGIVNSLWLTLWEKKSYLPTEGREDREMADSELKDREGSAKQHRVKQKSFIQPAVTSQVLMLLQALLWKVRDVEADILQKLTDTFSSVVNHLQLTSTCLEENTDKLVLPTVSLINILLLLLHSLKFIPSQVSSTVFLKLVTKLGYDGSLLTPDKGHNSRENTLRRNRKAIPAASSEQIDAVESEDRIISQDSKNMETEQKTDTGDSVLEGNDEQETKACLQVVKNYVRKLMTIIASNRPETHADSEEHTAGVVTVISWCLQQLDNIDYVNTIGSFIKWLNLCCTRNSATVKVIASDTNVSQDIFETLLGVYPKVDSLTVTAGDHDNKQTELQGQLNTVLEQVAAVRTRFNHEKLPCARAEEQSLILRKFFLTQHSEDGGTRVAEGGTRVAEGGRRVAEGGTRVAEGGTRVAEGGTRVADGGRRVAVVNTSKDKTEESAKDDSSSDERSEIIEYQEFKVAPEIKAYFKDKMTDTDSKTVSSSDKSPKKRNKDKRLGRSDSERKKRRK